MELVATARNPIPSSARCGEVLAHDGVRLRYALWRTTATRGLGTVCLFNGRAEFIEKYFETITDLRRRGFAVATLDWRGQGGSDRLLPNRYKGHVESFADYDQDLRRFMTEIVLPECPAPYYALAHSMGGHIILRSAQTKVCWFDRIVLSAPMIAFAKEQTSLPALGILSEMAALAGLSDFFVPGGKAKPWETEPFEENLLTSDRARYERMKDVVEAAPWLGLGSPTIGWVAAAVKSMAEVNALALVNGIKVPTLIIACGNDKVVSTEAIELFASRLKTCSRIVVAGSKHEILQERDDLRDQFWAAFDAYIPGSNRAVLQGGIGL